MAAAELLKIEMIVGRSAPQAQRVDGLAAICNDGPIEWHTDQGGGAARDGLQIPAVHLERAAELDFYCLVRTKHLPGIAAAQPEVRTFALPAVFDRLLEHAIFITQSVAHR